MRGRISSPGPQALGFLDTNSFLPRAGETRLARGNYPNLYLLANHRFLDGYVAIAPSRQLDYHQPNALRVAQVEYAHRGLLRGHAAAGRGRAARPWLVSRARRTAARATGDRCARQHAAGGRHRADRCDAHRARDARSGAGGRRGGRRAAAGAARIVADLPGEIAVEVKAASRQLLVMSESFDAGWRAALDGQPLPVERVNGDFLGGAPGWFLHGEISVPAPALGSRAIPEPSGLVFGLWLCGFPRRTVDRRL